MLVGSIPCGFQKIYMVKNGRITTSVSGAFISDTSITSLTQENGYALFNRKLTSIPPTTIMGGFANKINVANKTKLVVIFSDRVASYESVSLVVGVKNTPISDCDYNHLDKYVVAGSATSGKLELDISEFANVYLYIHVINDIATYRISELYFE